MEDSPPTTFVPADDNLFPPLAHSGMWLALGIVAGLLAIVLVLWMLHAVPDAAAKARAAQLTVKGQYLAELDALYRRYAEQLIDERQLHHELSRTVRRFAAEHGAARCPLDDRRRPRRRRAATASPASSPGTNHRSSWSGRHPTHRRRSPQRGS